MACAVLVGTRDGARLGPIGAAVVDHGLQSGSDAVAAAAADVARHAVQAASQELERAAAHLGGAR